MSSVSKSDIDKNFGKILRDFRIKKGMTQEQLSEKLGISLKYISRIENGNNGVKTQTLINYMNILVIDNQEIVKNMKICEKLSTLSEEKKDFLNSLIDLLQALN